MHQAFLLCCFFQCPSCNSQSWVQERGPWVLGFECRQSLRGSSVGTVSRLVAKCQEVEPFGCRVRRLLSNYPTLSSLLLDIRHNVNCGCCWPSSEHAPHHHGLCLLKPVSQKQIPLSFSLLLPGDFIMNNKSTNTPGCSR